MHNHRLSSASILLLVLVMAQAPIASAQTAAPRDPAAASRAAREADNPLRVIIEASKLKVRIKPDGDGSEAPPAEKRPAKPVVAKSAPAGSAPTTAVAKAPAAASQAAPPEPPVTLAKAAEAMPTALAAPAPIVPAPKPQALPPLPLKLAQLVEPTLPDSVLRRMRNDVEVVVGFTVNADGSVSDVAIRSSPLKSLEGSIIEAVSQWRYEPIREARAHAVQLVLRANH